MYFLLHCQFILLMVTVYSCNLYFIVRKNLIYSMLWQVYNPATGESIADVACMGGRETNDAISSAYDAFRCMRLHILMLYPLFQIRSRNVGGLR